MIVYLTGATGLAGAAIAEAFARRGHKVVGVAFQSEATSPAVSEWLRFDLGNEDEVIHSLLDRFPDVIVNAAAISSPAACDEDPEKSRQVNVKLPIALARIAHHLSARLIHLSTDMVFDGKKGHYRPDSPTAPTSLYGEQKLEAEKEVLNRAPEFATVIRTTLLMGDSPGGRRSVHEKLFESWASGKKTPLFVDELRQPCLAENLAEVVLEIAERNDLLGIYHWAGAEELSRFEIGQRILEHFKLPSDLIERASLRDDAKFADRPADLTLDTSALTGKLKTRPLPFDEQLQRLKVPIPFRSWYNSL
ncbi:MAG TPA: SDR family oxidoreductase [Opitutales bacterium]|nr:SDR family oxidoreductase [Opitutales bacterium]